MPRKVMPVNIHFTLNGRKVQADIEPRALLLHLLRDRFDLTGAKEGCGQGECGACTVIVAGRAVNSCLVLACQVDGKEVITIEGLDGPGGLDPVQEAFIGQGAMQCGYCTPGMILSAKALLMRNPHPTAGEVKEALAGNLCRCTGYVKPIQAVAQAARVITQLVESGGA
jgi:carbon-monoxide dehydrogenase small subunit